MDIISSIFCLTKGSKYTELYHNINCIIIIMIIIIIIIIIISSYLIENSKYFSVLYVAL